MYPLFSHHIFKLIQATTNLCLSSYAYKLGPCGTYGSSSTCVDADGISLVAPISVVSPRSSTFILYLGVEGLDTCLRVAI